MHKETKDYMVEQFKDPVWTVRSRETLLGYTDQDHITFFISFG